MSSTFFAATHSSAIFGETGTSKSVSTTPFKAVNATGSTQTTCAAWGNDGSVFIGTQDGSVDKYNRQGSHICCVYTGSTAIVALTVKDAQLIVGHENSVSLVDMASGKQSEAQISITGALKSLSLSSDKELLAITTNDSISVHNLSTRVSTTLNSLHLPNELVCGTFHPHRRTTLLVGCASQVMVFDATKPTAPSQTISLGSNQQVADICFSNSVRGPIATATRSGSVYFLDLEKEKISITQTVELKVELCAIAISADNTLLMAGTVEGQLLLQDIRASGKPIQSVSIGQSEAVIALAPLPKRSPRTVTTAISAKSAATTKAVSTRAQPLTDNNVQRKVSARAIARKPSEESTASKKEVDTKPTYASTPVKKKPAIKEITSRVERINTEIAPVRATRAANYGTRQKESPVPKRKSSPRVSTSDGMKSPPFGSVATSPTISPVAPSRVTLRSNAAARRINSPGGMRPRPSSTFSHATTERIPSPDLPTVGGDSITHPHEHSVVPLPDIIQPQEPKAPVPPIDLTDSPKVDRAMLGMGTFEVERWIAQDAKGCDSASMKQATVDLRSATPSPSSRGTVHQKAGPRVNKIIQSQALATKTPPRRSSAANYALESGTMQLSPMRSPARPGLSQPNSVVAQEFLRNVVREAMAEQQEGQLEELRAMHLDMVKMGRSWKNELRTLMQEYVGDFKVLHEENARLRAENERLRRGY